MANPFTPPSQPASYNSNPPSDDGTVSTANLVTWNASIKAKIGDPLVTWINNLLTNLTGAFSVVLQGPATSTAGNIATFADNSGKTLQDSGVGVSGAVPSGTMAPYAGVLAPSTWLFCFGQAVSRTGANANLFSATTIQTTGNTHTSITIDGMGSTTNMMAGMPISGSGIQAGTTIASIVSGTSITLSLATTTSVNGVAIVVAPWGVGDGTTTFNMPDGRGRGAFGFDAMGGSAASRLGSNTSAGGFTGTNYLGQTAGAQTHTQTVAEIATHNHTASSSFSGNATSTTSDTGSNAGLAASGVTPLSSYTPAGSVSTTVNNNGSSTSFNITPPGFTVNWIIKL